MSSVVIGKLSYSSLSRTGWLSRNLVCSQVTSASPAPPRSGGANFQTFAEQPDCYRAWLARHQWQQRRNKYLSSLPPRLSPPWNSSSSSSLSSSPRPSQPSVQEREREERNRNVWQTSKFGFYITFGSFYMIFHVDTNRVFLAVISTNAECFSRIWPTRNPSPGWGLSLTPWREWTRRTTEKSWGRASSQRASRISTATSRLPMLDATRL